MGEKILQALCTVRNKLTQIKVSKAAMKYIYWYAVLVVFNCLLYLIGWCADWYIMGKPDILELRLFLHEIASAPWVALIGFIAKMLIDKDEDGVPDELESDDK